MFGGVVFGHFHIRLGGARQAQIGVVGHGKILQHLLRHLGKDRRGDRGAVVASLGIVQNHGHRDNRIVDRRDADKRSDVHGLRVQVRRRIDLLRRAGLATGGVAVEPRLLARAVNHHALHHLAHLGRGHGGDDAARAGRQRIGKLMAG